MIFDGLENDEDLFAAKAIAQQLPEPDLSLDDLVLQRNEREANRDFGHLYETFQVTIARHKPQLFPEEKENIQRNGMKKTKEKADKKEQMQQGQQIGNTQITSMSFLGAVLPPQPSITFDVEHVNLSIRPSLARLNVNDSPMVSNVKRKNSAFLDELFEPELHKVQSPPHKTVLANLLGRRCSITHFREPSPQQAKNHVVRRRKHEKIETSRFESSLHCRVFIKNPQRSVQDVLPPPLRPKRKTRSKRSFSVNSIAREIFRAATVPQNVSFQSILSMEYIGSSNIEIDDHLTQLCPLCQKDFWLKETLAKTHACDHLFHKTCLDTALSTNVADGIAPRCPTCYKDI